MEAQILSLNIGLPQEMDWEDKKVKSSMKKSPLDGPLVVNKFNIEGDKFANPKAHGTPDSVVYALGMDATQEYMEILGKNEYSYGALGENISLDRLNENDISVGDVFQVGEVKLQATYPRIPCTKVNIRMKHPHGQKAMIELGRSGVYFRVLTPGIINKEDSFIRSERAKSFFSISEAYRIHLGKNSWSLDDLNRARENGYFPSDLIENFEKRLK